MSKLLASGVKPEHTHDTAWPARWARWRTAGQAYLDSSPIEPILHPVSSRLRSFGLMMLLGNPIYYWVWAHGLVQPYENLAARLLVSVLASVLLLPQVTRDPTSWRTGVLFVGIVWIQLPVFFIWMYLCNGGSPVWMASVVGMILIWYHVTDWRIASVGLVLAVLAAWGLFALTDLPVMPPWRTEDIVTHAMVISFGLFMAVLLGVFSANAKQVQMKLSQAHALQTALQSLAGSIAHEMRNPLGQIKHALSMSAELLPVPGDASAVLTPEQLQGLHRHLSQGQVAIKRGLQVIDMTLDEVNFRSLDPAQFVNLSAARTVQKAVEEYSFESASERAKVDVLTVQDFHFKGHETALMFVLFNLMRNALYYFKQYPQARITITIDQPFIRVKDTGPGMSAQVRSRLFQAFHTAGKADGTGLGLAYCQRAMRAFGGHIACDSVQGQYTEFSLQFVPLPAGEFAAQPADAEPQELQASGGGLSAPGGQPSAVLQGKTLLVADDVAMNRNMLRAYVERWGMQVLEAEHGQQVLSLLANPTLKVDVAILDMHMPGMGGIELTCILRASARHKHLPIVALTGNCDAQSRQMADEAGMNDFISKPFDVSVLHQTLSQLLSGPQTEGGLAAAPSEPVHADGVREQPSAALSLLNLEHLQELQHHVPEFLQTSWPAYVANLAILQARMRAALAQRNHEELHRAVHTLVGNSGNVGALAVHRFLKAQVMPDVERGQWPRDEHWLETLVDLCQRTELQMAQYLAQQPRCGACA